MKRRSIAGGAIAVAASFAIASSVLAFSGIANGSFEEPSGTVIPRPPGFVQLISGSTGITGWTVTTGSVDWIDGYWIAQDGGRSLDMTGSNGLPGAISQTFDTTVNNTYVVEFALAGNPAGGSAVKTLTVVGTGSAPITYTFDTTGHSLSSMGWTTEAHSFVATGASTTLTFTSMDPGFFGPALDNVRVTEIVATGANCKNDGWLTMLDTAGNSFKNQGDCVSFYATDGKNLADAP